MEKQSKAEQSRVEPEKLLHERLREWANNVCPTNHAFSEYGIDEPSIDQEEAALFNAIADEIERYYITRQRFEDGEIVEVGKPFLADNGMADTVRAINVWEDGHWAVHGANYLIAEGEAGEFVKLPIPKVYDADGVDYKRGEHVWDIEEGLMWRVKSFTAEKVNCERGDEEGWMSGEPTGCSRIPTVFTHERPVFDAEGVKICKGDTVYNKLGEKLIVCCLTVDDDGNPAITAEGRGNLYLASALTHREPDSLEKVIDEMNDATHDAGYQTNCTVRNWADRLTYFIERGA